MSKQGDGYEIALPCLVAREPCLRRRFLDARAGTPLYCLSASVRGRFRLVCG